ncbi:Exodeoxyribonuclease I subunit C [Rosenbergiella nectarea]|uniref:Exodeoxyribonuclease I n=1 Tax=Rosenbergiella nectarea TaxID=988801 RepID=A0A1H9M0D3_9GAMM|nr:exodeoxyribonuclease I [Rosenbergiella nectarea]SER17049.1 Exodeoxyribonuclease I subunit C [Rosenbergiella nectarea]
MKNNDTVQPTFLFHDYETFGTHPALDRPAQFAGVRTDSTFTVIGEPEVFYCKLADDYLPQPEAVLITHITPQEAQQKGVIEAAFTQRIHHLFSEPNTCIIGYNNIRFDDEVTRHLFYRNFHDPYGWSWQEGNSRWDLLDVMRACYALRPEGIEWPENEQGLPSFKLEHLTKANGIAHTQAHDAMSDVYATIAMAQLVKEKQPKLFDFLFTHRNKHRLTSLIDIPQMKPLVHVSGMFGAARGNTSWIVPLAWHPDNKNALITVDLAGEIAPLLTLDSDALREKLYQTKEERGDSAPIPLKLVHINKCPVLAPASVLRPEDAARLGIDRQTCLNNLTLLRQHPEIREKVVALFADKAPFPANHDVDNQLYDGFFSTADKQTMDVIRQTHPQHLPAMDLRWSDKRIDELLFRFRARNYPGTLDEIEQQRWMEYRRSVLTPDRVNDYFEQLTVLLQEHQESPDKVALLQALARYAQELLS